MFEDLLVGRDGRNFRPEVGHQELGSWMDGIYGEERLGWGRERKRRGNVEPGE